MYLLCDLKGTVKIINYKEMKCTSRTRNKIKDNSRIFPFSFSIHEFPKISTQ